MLIYIYFRIRKQKNQAMGILYVVPTPVGNLEDITLRAIRILKEADFVLAEDTRTSGKLLKHLEIQVPMYSHHKFNEHQTVKPLVERIQNSEHHVALISDAGTPAISDPGFLLVRECVKNGVEVQCLPGATAFVPALVSSALPSEKFVFEGFLPQKKRKTDTPQFLEGRATHDNILRVALSRAENTYPACRIVWRRQTSSCCARNLENTRGVRARHVK